jgi:hypothetical protein
VVATAVGAATLAEPTAHPSGTQTPWFAAHIEALGTGPMAVAATMAERDGRQGVEGEAHSGSVRFTVIDPLLFNQMFNRPAIISIDKEVVEIGDTIVISGRNFQENDKVLFNGVEGVIQGRPSTSLLNCTVPDIMGGSTEVTVEQSDGTLPNPYDIVIKPKITSILKALLLVTGCGQVR